MTPVRKIYQNELIKEGIIQNEQAEKLIKDEIERFNQLFIESNTEEKTARAILEKKPDIFKRIDTAIKEDDIRIITKGITSIPTKFKANPKIIKLCEHRAQMIESDMPAIDWALAEALAFGSILLDGKEIRFSGQDSRRGTFSQRHAVITDMETEDIYVPLNRIRDGQSALRIFDSPLSELSVLGFEYGYSVVAKHGLTLWEAQFGDFANGAQMIIDQYISCAESKWGKTSNLVLLLPHSYDGQGPEHSSARLERYLQLCAEDNMFVCNPTSPAQYFHVLRRQTLLESKKPLMIMTPKGMLRNPMVVSSVKDFTEGSFLEILDDNMQNAENIKRIIFCSGKIYYELLEERDKRKIENIAIIRIEQLYPLHEKLLKNIISKFKNAGEFLWVQEEPQNQGAYNYIAPKIQSLFKTSKFIKYIGRRESPATATGSLTVHQAEQKTIIDEALG